MFYYDGVGCIIVIYIQTPIMACIIRGNVTFSIVGTKHCQNDLNRYDIKAKTVSLDAAA